MTTMTTVLAVVQCQEWGDETRKIRINFPKSGADDLSFTGRQLYLAIMSKARQMLGLVSQSSGQWDDNDDGDRVEIYDSARECFVCLKDFDLWGVDIAPRFGRLVRCIAHLTADEADSSFSNTNQQSSRDQTEQTPSSPLAIMGRYFHYDPNGMNYCGKRLIVKERSNDLEEDGTGLNIWDGAILLANYLELHQNIVQGKRVLELGSGPGFVGIAAGLAGALEVVMTDLSYCIPLMNANVERNIIAARSAGCQRMTCSVLDYILSDESHKTICNTRKNADNTTGTENKVPFLGDIPVLGRLFKSTTTGTEKKNLMIFLRPTVLNSVEKVKEVTARKYSGVWEVEIEGTEPRGSLSDLFDGKH